MTPPRVADPLPSRSIVGAGVEWGRGFLDPLTSTALALMATTVINAGLGVLFWVVASRTHDAERVGQAAALISAMMLLSIVAQLNLAMGIPRLLPQVHRPQRAMAGAYGVTVLVGCVVSVAFVLVAPRVSAGFRFLGPGLAVGLVAAVALWTVFALQDAALTATGWARSVPVENAIFGVLKIGLMVWFVQLFGTGIFSSWVAACAVLVIPVNWLLFRRVLGSGWEPKASSVLPIGDRRKVGRYLGFDYAASLLSQGYNAVLPLLVVAVLGSRANAYFYVCFLIATAIAALTHALGTSMVVHGARDEGSVDELARQSLGRYAWTALPATVVLIAGAGIALRVFGQAYSTNGTLLLRLLLLGTIPQAVVTIYLCIERVRGRAGVVVGVEAFTVAVTTFAVVVSMRWWGLDGMGIGWVVSQTVVACVVVAPLWVLVRRPRAR